MSENANSGFKILSVDQPEMLIEAFVPEKNNPAQFHRVAFKTSAIEYLMEINDRVSCVVLKNSLTIPVALSFRELKRAIHEPDFKTGTSLDFTLITGKAVAGIQMPQLADAFNAANNEKGTLIRAVLRKWSSNEFVTYDFNESSIASLKPMETIRSRSGHALVVKFNTAADSGPFNDGEAILDMPKDDFINLLAAARGNGFNILDLCAVFASDQKKYGLNPQ